MNTTLLGFSCSILILILITVCSIYASHNKIKQYTLCTGTVSDIRNSTAFISINERTYEMKYNTKTMKLNQTIELYAEKKNPLNIVTKESLYSVPKLLSILTAVYIIFVIVVNVILIKGV